MEFRLCPVESATTRATQTCLDRRVLRVVTESGAPVRSRYGFTKAEVTATGNYELYVQLPQGLTCRQCVLQWKYNTGGCILQVSATQVSASCR